MESRFSILGPLIGTTPPVYQVTSPGNVTGGLPVSAESDYWYSSAGGGYYKSGTHDPWEGFVKPPPLQVSQTGGVGTGIIVGTGPDPIGGTIAELATYGSAVIAVLVNNTKDTVLTLLSSSGGIGSNNNPPPTPVPPQSAVFWATNSDSAWTGTQGTAQYYPSRLGACPAPDLNDTASLTFNWDNPELGSNSYSITAPTQYLASYLGGDGTCAVVIYVINDALVL